MLERTYTETLRLISKCKRCGTVRRIERVNVWEQHRYRDECISHRIPRSTDPRPLPANCECGRSILWREMHGIKRPEVPCDRRCTGAKGHSCECSCGGKHHGEAYAVSA